jgi:RNA polymerase sigma-70 factor (ECF subfamily)
MWEKEWQTDTFEAHRDHLRGVAYRMLGSASEADDAVQEAWLRFSRADSSDVDNIGGWLTTIVARVSLDMLRTRRSRREEALDTHPHDAIAGRIDGGDPEYEALLADSVGPAVLLILETLAPAERLAFVLHDMFAVPFDEIGPIVGRSPVAARQLASRARRRVQGAAPSPEADQRERRHIVDAFLTAARNGDFDTLIALLDQEAVLRADARAVRVGAKEAWGADAVAGTFSGRAHAAEHALITGAPGAVWAPRGTPQVVFEFVIDEDAITAINLIADRDRVSSLDISILDD